MKKYEIQLEKPAAKFIRRLPKPEKERILRAIAGLPLNGDIKRLQGPHGKGMFRLRVGSYRILYIVKEEQLVVCVVDAGNRGQIYNDL